MGREDCVILKAIENLRKRNNKEWMRLVSISVECDAIKRDVKKILGRILKNDKEIQKELRKIAK